jgi:hypothetical protein
MRIRSRLGLFAAGLCVGLSACQPGAPAVPDATTAPSDHGPLPGDQPAGAKMKLTIGSKTFTATLADNPAAAKLKGMFPLTLDMQELNGNEKFARLKTHLPTDTVTPGTIHAGDLMLWQGDTLVLFDTAYGYTRVGRLDDPAGLNAAVGPAGVTVRFESE